VPHPYRGRLATPQLPWRPVSREPTDAEFKEFFLIYLTLLYDLFVHFRIRLTHPRSWERLYKRLLRRYRPDEARRLRVPPSANYTNPDKEYWRPLVEDIVWELPIPGFRVRRPDRIGGRPSFNSSQDAVVVWAIESVQRRHKLSVRSAAECAARNALRDRHSNDLRGRSAEEIRRHYSRARARLQADLRHLINTLLKVRYPRRPN